MYERKIIEDLDCGIIITLKVLGSKWKPCIIDSINKGVLRPSQLHQIISGASPRVIDMQLKELTEFGVLTKKSGSGFPLISEYSLTDFGKSVLPILSQMEDWGIKNKEYVKQAVWKQNRLKEL